MFVDSQAELAFLDSARQRKRPTIAQFITSMQFAPRGQPVDPLGHIPLFRQARKPITFLIVLTNCATMGAHEKDGNVGYR